MLETRPLKFNRRGLTEIVLICALIALSTYTYWSWQINGGHVAAMDTASTMPQGGLLLQILQHPAIVMSAVIAEFFLLLAFALALAPISWWLHADHVLGMQPTHSTTLLRWLGKKVNINPNEAEDYNNEFAPDAAGEQVNNEQAVPGQTQPGQPGASPLVTGQVQPLSDKPATVNEIKPGEAPPLVEGAPLPLSDLLIPEAVPDEDNPLSDLANISDILNSAFDEDAGIDEDQASLGRAIEVIDIDTLRISARQVLATFLQ